MSYQYPETNKFVLELRKKEMVIIQQKIDILNDEFLVLFGECQDSPLNSNYKSILKEILFNQFSEMFGPSDFNDNEFNYFITEFEIIFSDGNRTNAIARIGEYYIYLKRVF